MKEIQNVIQKLLRDKSLRLAAAAVRAAANKPLQKHSHPRYTGVT